MKKQALLLSLIMLFALSATSMANFTQNFSGRVEVQAIMDENFEPALRAFSNITWSLSGNVSRQHIRLNAGLRSVSTQSGDRWQDLRRGSPADISRGVTPNFGFTYAQLEINGPFWEDGPSYRTRVGDITNIGAGYSQYIHSGYWNGLTIEGIEIGPVDVNYGYIFADKERTLHSNFRSAQPRFVEYLRVGDPVQYLAAKGSVGNLNYTVGTAQHHAATDFVVEASLRPSLTTSINGAYIVDGVYQKSAYWATARTNVSTINLNVEVQNVEDGYNPAFGNFARGDGAQVGYTGFPMHWGEDDVTDKTIMVLPYRNVDGYKISADTELWIFGPTLKGWYASRAYEDGADPETEVAAEFNTELATMDVTLATKVVTNRDTGSPVSTTTNSVKMNRSFGILDTTYTFSIERDDQETETINELNVTASQRADVFVFKGVNLSATANYKTSRPEGEQLRLSADARYTTPTGINLGVHYGNFGRETGYDAPSSIKDDFGVIKGFYFTAGTSISF